MLDHSQAVGLKNVVYSDDNKIPLCVNLGLTAKHREADINVKVNVLCYSE